MTDPTEELEAISTIVEHALAELETGELDELEESLRAIRDRADGWGGEQ